MAGPHRIDQARAQGHALRAALDALALIDRDMVDVMWTPTGRCTACVTPSRSEDPSAHTTLARTQRAYGQSPALAALARAADAVMQPLLALDPVAPSYTHATIAWRFTW